MKIDFEDITWEMYCEYLGVSFFEPFNNVSEEMDRDVEIRQNIFYYLRKFEPVGDKDIRRELYNDYFLCTMDKNYFLKSDFYAYLINKNRTELIEEMLDERKDG